ncbi:MAG TPA: sensor histidine kinase [Clostridia bacterium]|nr:sensor histidine kinase [Clostridia bacterium]
MNLKFFFNFFKRKSIQFKLLSYFLIVTLFPTLTLGIIGNIIYINAMEREVNAHTTQMIGQVKKNIEFYIKDMDNIIYVISQEPEIIKYMNITEDTPQEERASIEAGVRRIFNSFTAIHPEISGILMVNEKDFDVSNEMFRIARDPLTSEIWYKQAFIDTDSIQLLSKPIGRNITTKQNYGADDVVSIVKAVKDPVSGAFKGVVLIDMKLDIIEKTIKDITLGKSGFLYVMDQYGDVVYAPVNPIIYRVKAEWLSEENRTGIVRKIRDSQYQIIYSDSSYTKWKMVGVFSLSESLQEVTKLRSYSMIIGSLTLVLAVIISVFFTSSIAKPIMKLRMLMKKAEGGDLDVHFNSRYGDEIGQLGNSFNNMIGEIKKLIQMVYAEQKNKREAELKTLQAQIKPHFLYNTLDTIQWMAQDHQADDIVEIVSALTKLFRIGLSKGKEMLKVRDELEHVKSYMVIQKARYEDKLDYEIIYEESILECRVLKLILQPLVENAIYHGIKEKRGSSKIVITAKQAEGRLYFSVSDDGAGIEPEKMREIEAMLKGRKLEGNQLGYGIFNVNERIRLSFGTEYGLNYISTPGIGTTVEVWHPLIEE